MDPVLLNSESIVAALNSDKDSITQIIERYTKIPCAEASVLSVDRFGFDVRLLRAAAPFLIS